VKFKGHLIIDNACEDKNSTGDFSHLSVGDNCYIGMGVYFDLSNRITIHDNVVISGNVSFITHADCNRSIELAAAFPRRCEPVVIEEGAWIAFGATVAAGVTVGAKAVIAAGAVLLEDAQPRHLYGGVPARIIRIIDGRIQQKTATAGSSAQRQVALPYPRAGAGEDDSKL
jgi:acetyltransferase-like isoleucine patch superfamily enzyme